jgi:hypothetical protein
LILIIIEMLIMIKVIAVILVININSNSNSDFDFYSLNCYFLKFFCKIDFFLFYHLIFNLLKIKLYGFSISGASGVIT